jgi:hypothetical protein
MAVSETSSSAMVATPDFERMTVDHIRHWCEICDRFNEWQHKQIIGGKPTPQEREEHRQGLKWLLRLTKMMHYTASDPEFPDPSVVALLQAKIWQLEQAWKLLYRRLSQPELGEAEMVLKDVFPDEPGA